ncbi:MAG: membrane protein insertase YidC [Candidatus Omnitrophica bacterium]|nr:membrane protein insertase YidC [Candidatus Omnitrophota bacterium]MDD5573703.1 membrane protein insertase YidC [Candidatus Omnitrophota bacterium]
MEKRFFLALALSFLVLMAYSALMPKSKTIAIKEDIVNLTSPSPLRAQEPKKEAVKEQALQIFDKSLDDKDLYKFENGDLVFFFSRRGGYIKSVFDKTLEVDLDLVNIGLVPEWSTYDFSLNVLPKGAEFIYRTAEGMQIKKSYRIKDDETMDLAIAISDASSLKSTNYTIIVGGIAASKQLDQMSRRYFEGCYQIRNIVSRKPVYGLKASIDLSGKIDWAGLRDKYFCVVFSPQFIVNKGVISSQDNNSYTILTIDNTEAPEGSSVENLFKVYVGLQDEKKLVAVGNSAERVVNFGFFDMIAKAILFLLTLIHRVIHNWGWSIIIVTTVIYFVLFPLSYKSMASMKRMQALQPKIEELKLKFKDNPQKMQMATMELYKAEKINPLGGCLPMLLQIPVFFSLYQLLMRFPNLRGAEFFWIKDLSSPDRLIVLQKPLPIIGNEINILPLLMAGVMYFQQKVSMTSKTATGAMADQQKMMAIMMPVLFGFLFYKMPSGLVLYWLVNSLLMLVFQWKISQTK